MVVERKGHANEKGGGLKVELHESFPSFLPTPSTLPRLRFYMSGPSAVHFAELIGLTEGIDAPPAKILSAVEMQPARAMVSFDFPFPRFDFSFASSDRFSDLDSRLLYIERHTQLPLQSSTDRLLCQFIDESLKLNEVG